MPDQAVIKCGKRGTEAYLSKQVLEFSRFACENKLTLSVFVNMSFKYNKLFIQYIIYCLKYAFPVTGGHGAAARSFSAKIATAYVKKKLTLRNSTKFFLTSQKHIHAVYEIHHR